MATPIWLRVCMVIDALLFLFGAYMGASAVEIARVSSSGAAVGIAFLFIALPVFAIAGPTAALKTYKRGRTRYAAGMMLVPMVYAAFLVLLLIYE